MSAQHTPGPWSLAGGPLIIEVLKTFGGEEWMVYPPLGETGPIAVAAGESNAHLIAAAPDLLEALEAFSKGLEGNLEGVGGGTCVSPSFTVQHFKNARAALAKAKGETK